MTDSMIEKVQFTALTNGGAALGRLADGRVIFAKGILPDEFALVRYEKGDSRFAIGELVDVLSPSERRKTAVCPLFGICSGCQFQFLDEAEQLKEKLKILVDQLQRIAKIPIPEPLIRPYIPSIQTWNYRKNVRFFIGEDGSLCLPTNKEDEWVSVRTCPVCSEGINRLIPMLAFDPDTGILQAEIREGDEEEIQLILRGETEKPENEIEVDIPISVVYSSPDGSFVMAGDSTVHQTLAEVEIAVSEDTFFYPNPGIMQLICDSVLAWLPNNDVYNVLNLNCGSGFWSKWFAKRCKKVLAQDQDEKNAEDFVLNLGDFDNVELYIGEAQDIIPGLKDKIKVVISETGMGGLTKETISQIGACGAGTVIYIGHDAAILARDAARFVNQGFSIGGIIPFDNEPQTAKISAVCIFSR